MTMNRLYPDFDERMNGYFYNQENEDTFVVYKIYNWKTFKSYIGKVQSYIKLKNGKNPYYSAHGRFVRHLSNCKGAKRAQTECPIFYNALREYDMLCWYVTILRVCKDDKEATEYEKFYINQYMTYHPFFGYNYFISDDKPKYEEYRKDYHIGKAKANHNRALGGKLKRTEQNKGLPPCIKYYKYCSRLTGEITREGYVVEIRVENGKRISKTFSDSSKTMEQKLKEAQDHVIKVRKEHNLPY